MSSSQDSEDSQEPPRQPVANNPNTFQPVPRIGSQPSSSSRQKVERSSSSQVRRVDSGSSVGSVGMSSGRSNLCPDPDAPAKILPGGDSTPDQAVYDCVVYLFYCPTHDRIAVSTSAYSSVVWYPFLALEKDFTHAQAAQNGVAIFLGRRRSENDQEEAFQVPKYTCQFVHMLHVQLPSHREFARLAAFVQVEGDEKFHCCQPTTNIKWVQTSDILQDQVDCLWGPEVKLFLNLLIQPEPLWIDEYSREDALRLLTNSDREQANQAKFVAHCKIPQDTVLAIFEDYIEHCFPAMLMSMESLKSYLIKHGFDRKDARFCQIHNAMAYKGRNYLDFDEFLVGILCLEPTTDHSEGRVRMLFRFYDADQDKALNLEEFLGLMRHLNPKSKESQLREMMMSALETLGFRDDRLQYEAFHRAIVSNKLRNTSLLCRSPKPIIPQVLADAKRRAISLSSSKSAKQGVKREGRGICNVCRAQELDFSVHTVFLDMAGLCQRPMRIKDVIVPNDNVMTPPVYSSEIVFSVESIFRTLIDNIREFYYRSDATEKPGLMACSLEEAQHFASQVAFLTQHVGELLATEERLIHTNAPAIVIGDIQGNLCNLMALERSLWQSVPVLTSNLIFLGNYIGPSQAARSVEVTCYILSLKMMSPNKVFILRGSNETRQKNRATLLMECNSKYGPEFGKLIWERLNEALDKLPFAAVIDENIFAVHSGIPSGSQTISKFFELNESIQIVDIESPMAYELISSVPADDDRSQSEGSVSRSSRAQEQFSRTTPEYSQASFLSFLKTNNLTHVIRGHDSPPVGYLVHFGGRCITISAAIATPVVAFVDGSNETIRLVKMRTEQTEAGE